MSHKKKVLGISGHIGKFGSFPLSHRTPKLAIKFNVLCIKCGKVMKFEDSLNYYYCSECGRKNSNRLLGNLREVI